MSYMIVLATGVEEELEAAAFWIEEQREGYGEKFMDAFDGAVNFLGAYASSCAIKYKDCREIKLGRFSYVLIYKILDNKVLVTRLIHTSRHPKKRYQKKRPKK